MAFFLVNGGKGIGEKERKDEQSKKMKMIITQTPLRISFFGGGTDLPNFYRRHGGCVVNMAIDRYVYVGLRKRLDSRITIDSPFGHESCENPHHIEHQCIRAVLQNYGVNHGLSVWINSDVTHLGCGLGTDSAVIAGFLNGLFRLRGGSLPPLQLARAAAQIQLEMGNSGVQDAYPVSLGGYNCLRFSPDDSVDVESLGEPKYLEELLLFYIGARDSRAVQSAPKSDEMLMKLKNLTERFAQHQDKSRSACPDAIGEDADKSAFEYFLSKNWEYKRQCSVAVSTERIDRIYETGIDAGASSGKLLGAGGGGYLLFFVWTENQAAVRRAMGDLGLLELTFGIDREGSRIYDRLLP